MSISESEKKKRRVRQSKRWKEFRHEMNVRQKGLCYISGKKLNKQANLHHMDLDIDHYDDLSNPENFVFLNKQMHEVVHVLYRYFKEDEDVLERLRVILLKMKLLNP